MTDVEFLIRGKIVSVLSFIIKGVFFLFLKKVLKNF